MPKYVGQKHIITTLNKICILPNHVIAGLVPVIHVTVGSEEEKIRILHLSTLIATARQEGRWIPGTSPRMTNYGARVANRKRTNKIANRNNSNIFPKYHLRPNP